MEQFEEKLLTNQYYEMIDDFCDDAINNLLKNREYNILSEKRKSIKKEYLNIKNVLEGNNFVPLKKSETKKIFEFLTLVEMQSEMEKREVFIKGLNVGYIQKKMIISIIIFFKEVILMLPIQPELVQKIKKIDLLTYLQNFEPDELVHDSKNTYSTKTHDSLKINNGKWYWFSQGIGGYTALDYLIKVKGLSFLEAINILATKNNLEIPINNYFKEDEKISKLILPQKNINNDKVIFYLLERGIDREIIDYVIENDLVYETKDNHNVVFVGKDYNENPRYAFIRGTNETRFMHDASGSDKEYSFRLLSKNVNDRVHIFESAIDLLSYATLMKMNNKNYKNENFIALSGVYQSSSNAKVPLALTSFLEKNKYINKIFLHLDNDLVGQKATKNIKNNLKNKYEVIDGKPFQGKDWNDFLLLTLRNIKKKK